MPNTAILVGNTDYRSLPKLECCHADVIAIKELLYATEKYEIVEIIDNADASELKDKIRAAVEKANSPAELFFYFTGHGYSYEDEFFYCASNFDANRPNETGLSTTDLHTFLRMANAELVIKVVDACNSGTHLVKADIGLTLQNKHGFKNLIQISSCLDSQSSLTGYPLSLFTDKFRNAILSKTEGVVYYTDVIAALRDQFIGNDAQIPFFVSQYTGREQFVDDARKLDRVRESLRIHQEPNSLTRAENAAPIKPPTLVELLHSVESRLATPEAIGSFVGKFFDNLKSAISQFDFSDLFNIEFAEHDDFQEHTARRFVTEILSREKRVDDFVTAGVSRKRRRSDPFGMTNIFSNFYDDEQYAEVYDLELNCKMERAQLRVTLTPKFSALQRVTLVVTCAPSLEICYVFEVVTQHALHDFGKYNFDGVKGVQRWYKFGWKDSTDGVVKKISDALSAHVRAHIENTVRRLNGE
jgi:hypothetical protein